MFRATTPTHKFIFDIDVSDADELLVTYAQKGTIKVEKRKSAFTFDTETIGGQTKYTASVTLTQAETKLFTMSDHFNEKDYVQCQVRLLMDGTALASEVVNVMLKDVLNDEVLS